MVLRSDLSALNGMKDPGPAQRAPPANPSRRRFHPVCVPIGTERVGRRMPPIAFPSLSTLPTRTE